MNIKEWLLKSSEVVKQLADELKESGSLDTCHCSAHRIRAVSGNHKIDLRIHRNRFFRRNNHRMAPDGAHIVTL